MGHIAAEPALHFESVTRVSLFCVRLPSCKQVETGLPANDIHNTQKAADSADISII